MKKVVQIFALVAVIAVVFSSCLKDDNNNQPPIPSGGLMAFNLAPDADGIGIRLDGNNLVNQPLSYTNFTGGYLPIYTGERTARSFDYYTGAPIAAETKFSSVDSQYYSLFVVGTDSNYKNVIVTDNLDSIPFQSGKAFVRYINAVTDTTVQPEVTIRSGATDIVKEAAPFAQVSAFSTVDAGDISVSIKGGAGIDKSRTFSVEANKIYTVLLVGQPGVSDGSKAVDIKYIANGTVEETSSQE